MIFDIQRFSIHDGPGVRTVVFLKGCPLRCAWCHNPEGLSADPQISFLADKCIGCGNCLEVCVRDAHELKDGQHIWRRDLCAACGACAQVCGCRALELAGYAAEPDEVMAEVIRDKPFYDVSGGGLTLSGGEPLAQPEFVMSLLVKAREAGIHRCIETCGYARAGDLDRIAPHVNLFLFDLKDTDDARHRRFTGVSNTLILDNLRRLHDNGAAIRLRLPVIPGYNDRDDHLAAVIRLVKSMPRLQGVEIMPYHPLGRSKYQRLGLDIPDDKILQQSALPDSATIKKWRESVAM